MTSDQIQAAIFKSIRTVAPTMRDLGPGSALTGQDSSLDSIGFLTFLITLEGELDGRIDLAAILQEGVAPDDGPFRTVASLAAFIDERLNSRQ